MVALYTNYGYPFNWKSTYSSLLIKARAAFFTVKIFCSPYLHAALKQDWFNFTTLQFDFYTHQSAAPDLATGLFMFVIRLTFTKFTSVIVVHWHVIFDHVWNDSQVTWKNQWTTHQYGAHEYQVKIELYTYHTTNYYWYQQGHSVGYCFICVCGRQVNYN